MGDIDHIVEKFFQCYDQISVTRDGILSYHYGPLLNNYLNNYLKGNKNFVQYH